MKQIPIFFFLKFVIIFSVTHTAKSREPRKRIEKKKLKKKNSNTNKNRRIKFRRCFIRSWFSFLNSFFFLAAKRFNSFHQRNSWSTRKWVSDSPCYRFLVPSTTQPQRASNTYKRNRFQSSGEYTWPYSRHGNVNTFFEGLCCAIGPVAKARSLLPLVEK